MKRIFYLLLTIILIFQLYRLYQQYRGVSENLVKTESELTVLEKENLSLQADIEYFGNPENLAKEAKAKFDYKRPGEKMIIVVPAR